MTLVYRLIDEESQRQPVSLLCRALGVARSGFYEWQRSPVSDRQISDWMLTEQIRAIFEASNETYGSPRVHAELLLDHGVRVSSKRVARLMRQHGFRSVWAERRRRSTTKADGSKPAFDLVDRDFAVDGPDELWVADFSQVVTFSGPAYIAVVEDAWSRHCLGHAVRATKTVDMVLAALEMAIWRRGEMQAAGAIHHSDRGSQYTSFAFSRRLVEAGLQPSMGSVGDALDNAMCESLIGTLKVERLDRSAYRSVDDVATDVFDWIETWYNRRRRHTSLGMISPLEYESQHYEGVTVINP